MNCNKFIRGVAMLCASSLLWVSCKKTDTPNLDPVTNETNVKLGGFVEDDDAMAAKVPLIISSYYLESSKSVLLTGGVAVSSARGSGSKSGDRTAPSIDIISPTSSSTVSGTVNIVVNALDNVGVNLVSVSINGVALASSSTAPYSFTWNTTGLASGTHTISATAIDEAGNTKSTSVQVGINVAPSGDLIAPSVNITSPTDGSSVDVGAILNVNVTASDNNAVSSVSFSVDGVVTSNLSIAPYNFSWNTSGVSSGTHTLTASGRDAAGNIGTASITVTVNTIVIPPTSLPSSFQLITPPVSQQGNEGACVAFSTTYARSIEQYYRTNASSYSYSTNVFSPEYVYNQTKIGTECGAGTSMGRALDLMVSKGVCTWETMPYTDAGCSIMPTAIQDVEASNYKIGSYSKLLNTDIVAIKTMIATKHPVVINVTADNSFINAGAGFIWSSYSGSGALPHSIMICGYDDAKNAFKVMNSWGTTWGDAGFSWIDYNFFPQKSGYYVYVIN